MLPTKRRILFPNEILPALNHTVKIAHLRTYDLTLSKMTL